MSTTEVLLGQVLAELDRESDLHQDNHVFVRRSDSNKSLLHSVFYSRENSKDDLFWGNDHSSEATTTTTRRGGKLRKIPQVFRKNDRFHPNDPNTPFDAAEILRKLELHDTEDDDDDDKNDNEDDEDDEDWNFYGPIGSLGDVEIVDDLPVEDDDDDDEGENNHKDTKRSKQRRNTMTQNNNKLLVHHKQNSVGDLIRALDQQSEEHIFCSKRNLFSYGAGVESDDE